MKRKAYLSPLRGEVRRKNFMVLDIESKDGPSDEPGFTRPFMVGTYGMTGAGPEYKEFASYDRSHNWQRAYFEAGGCVDQAMLSILTEENRGKSIYAHNAGRFDFLFLIPWLSTIGSKLGFEFSIIPTGSSLMVLDVQKGDDSHKSKWRFLDSLRLIPTSLDKAAKAFGFAGKVEHDLHLSEFERKKWSTYLRGDCEQLYCVLERFHDLVEKSLGGEVGLTAPATSMKVFRRRYLKKAIHRSVTTHEFVRTGYYGGRVEPFRIEGDALHYFDINSSYPASMLEPMPVGKGVKWEGKPPLRLTQGKIGFCDCTVHVPEDCYVPPLPYRLNGKLCFPTGTFSGVWDRAELDLLQAVGGRVTEWRDSVWYSGEPIFREMVLDLYPYRDKGRADYDEGLAQVVKILLNSLYGKTGMREERKKIFYVAPGMVPPEGAVPIDGNVDSPVWVVTEMNDAEYIMPQLAAHVTALSRIRLWDKLFEIHQSGHDLYYCDTDSVVTDRLEESRTELGGWKNEFPDGPLPGKFYGPKLYVLGDLVKSKGLPRVQYVDDKGKTRERRVTKEDLERYALGEILHYDRLEKLGGLARAGFSRGPKMITVPRTARDGFTKREYLPDGNTRPWVLNAGVIVG